jgi:hypothetical protein
MKPFDSAYFFLAQGHALFSMQFLNYKGFALMRTANRVKAVLEWS